MKRSGISALVAAIAATILASTAAWADAPKFHKASSSVDGSGALVVSFDERGLGNENVDYELRARATGEYACVNGGNKHPQAANKETVNSEVSTDASFEPKNGRVIATIKSGPPSAGGFSCPPGQRLVLVAVSYANVVLTDVTNDVSASPGDVSRVLRTI